MDVCVCLLLRLYKFQSDAMPSDCLCLSIYSEFRSIYLMGARCSCAYSRIRCITYNVCRVHLVRCAIAIAMAACRRTTRNSKRKICENDSNWSDIGCAPGRRTQEAKRRAPFSFRIMPWCIIWPLGLAHKTISNIRCCEVAGWWTGNAARHPHCVNI